MINSVNQQNPKMNNAKREEKSTGNSTWGKSNRNTGISEYLSIIILNVKKHNSQIRKHRLFD
jgi:hypothetical protein